MLDFQAYRDKAATLKAAQAKNFVEALNEIEASGLTVGGLEEVSPSTFTIQPLKVLADTKTLGIYTGKDQTANFGNELKFIPLRAVSYRGIWDELNKKIVQRVFSKEVSIPQLEDRTIYYIKAIFGVTEDFRHFFVVEGVRSKIEPVAKLLEDLKKEAVGREGIYELLAKATVVEKKGMGGKVKFKTIDLALLGELPKELVPLAKVAAEFVNDYVEYRRNKPIQILGAADAEEAEASQGDGEEAPEELKEALNKF